MIISEISNLKSVPFSIQQAVDSFQELALVNCSYHVIQGYFSVFGLGKSFNEFHDVDVESFKSPVYDHIETHISKPSDLVSRSFLDDFILKREADFVHSQCLLFKSFRAGDFVYVHSLSVRIQVHSILKDCKIIIERFGSLVNSYFIFERILL